MTRSTFVAIGFVACGLVASALAAQAPAPANPHRIVYQGERGPGTGKRIVFLAGDHEYRSEEALPALGRLMARHYGFTSTVFITTDPKTGFIEPGSSHISGLEALKTADLLVVGLRFQDFPDDQMQHLVDYLDRGGPVVGLRTSTHAFQIRRPNAAFAKYTWDRGVDFTGGFGRRILGETWVGHYGTNHKQSSRLVAETAQAAHPILRGVKDMWVESGGYRAVPIFGSTTLVRGQVLNGMTPGAPAAPDKLEMAVAWVRTYQGSEGRSGRVFTTTHGASEDLRNEGFRRLLVNGVLWAAGLDAAISPTSEIGFVGAYRPTAYSFGGFVKNLKPADMAGWDTPIPR